MEKPKDKGEIEWFNDGRSSEEMVADCKTALERIKAKPASYRTNRGPINNALVVGITFDSMGISEEEYNELISDCARAAAKEHFVDLRDGARGHSYDVKIDLIKSYLREGGFVDENTDEFDYEKIGTTEEEIAELARENALVCAKDWIKSIREPSATTDLPKYLDFSYLIKELNVIDFDWGILNEDIGKANADDLFKYTIEQIMDFIKAIENELTKK